MPKALGLLKKSAKQLKKQEKGWQNLMAITKIMNIKNSKKYKKKAGKHLINALEYITNPQKTQNGLYVSGINCPANARAAFIQMTQTKKQLNSNGTRQAYHFILSCPEGEGTPEIMMELTKRFLEEYLQDDYEILYTVHDNTEKVHSHIIFNSVSFRTGKKYRYENGDWQKIIQPIVNKLCEEYGLSKLEIEENEKEKKREKGQRKKLQQEIDLAIDNSNSYDEFLNYMSGKYKIKYGKYLAMKSETGKQYIRVKSIGDLYAEDMIKLRIALKKGYLKKYNYNYNRRIKSFRADFNFIKKLKYKKMNPYQKWVLKKYMRQRKILKCNYATNTWKYKDDLKKLREAQKEYLYIVEKNITGPEQLEEKLVNLQQKKISIATERKKFNTEGKIYSGIIEKYNRLSELEDRYKIYLESGDEIFREAYEEYKNIQAEIKDMGLDIKKISDYIANIQNKKNEFTYRNTQINNEMKILKSLIEKNKNDGLYYIKHNIGIDENENTLAELENNFLLWSKSKAANSHTYFEVINHRTDNDYSRDNYYIICDRNNPEKYIRVKSVREIFNGEEYTRSYYEIYNKDKLLLKCDDGRFEGRTPDYWRDLRNEIQETSGLKDDNIIFENVENYTKYYAAYEKYKAEKNIKHQENIKEQKNNEVKNDEKNRRI